MKRHLLLPFLKPLAALALAASLASPAWASFSGSYDTSNWSTSNSNGGNGSVSTSSDSLVLTSSDFSLIDADPTDSELSYSITVEESTLISFSWAYSTEDYSSSYDVFGYTLDGVFNQLSSNDLSYLDSQSGSLSVWVEAGSSFAFVLESSDSEGGAASVTISDFSATTVPEPGSFALLAAGLGALGWVSRRRS